MALVGSFPAALVKCDYEDDTFGERPESTDQHRASGVAKTKAVLCT